MKVKKISNGKYRVYSVWRGRDNLEVRYSKKCDAETFIIHEGGYLGWEDFEKESDAQRYLNEKQGKIWW